MSLYHQSDERRPLLYKIFHYTDQDKFVKFTPTPAFTLTPTASRTSTSTPTGTPDGSDVIFADGFESGDLSAWPYLSTDAGDLSVGRSAALAGSQRLQVVIGDNHTMYVADDRADAEAHYRARFYFDPNSISSVG